MTDAQVGVDDDDDDPIVRVAFVVKEQRDDAGDLAQVIEIRNRRTVDDGEGVPLPDLILLEKRIAVPAVYKIPDAQGELQVFRIIPAKQLAQFQKPTQAFSFLDLARIGAPGGVELVGLVPDV